MVDNISWQSYWYTIAIILAGYYLVIYLLYFRNDFTFKVPSKPNVKGVGNEQGMQGPPKKEEEYLFDACLNELTAFFEEARQTKWIKEELSDSLQRFFKKYSSLKSSEFYTLLNHIVVGQSENYCSIHFNAEDIERVWLG